MDIPTLANSLNAESGSYAIGNLQALRKEIKGFTRRPGSSIFSDQTITDDWAFHHGGRAELQFNIGHDSGGDEVRHGIAFSFETSQTLPNIEVLRPKVRLFNEFLELYPDKYAHMRMWYWDENGRSDDQMPSSIPSERIKNGVFVFLGLIQPTKNVNAHKILRDFDDLLPLYTYVESDGTTQPVDVLKPKPFKFVHGCTVKKLKTSAKSKSDPVNVSLRHNAMQLALYKLLCDKHGKKNVGTELATGNGTRVDVVLKQVDKYWFYEIKTYHSPRACIRDAIGQLLEYSHWPNGLSAGRLVVVGENKLDADGKQYLADLRSLYSLPIDYIHVKP
jgi:hypothetical protein